MVLFLHLPLPSPPPPSVTLSLYLLLPLPLLSPTVIPPPDGPITYGRTSGMQFFGGALPDVEESLDNSIRFNYNSFGKAAITILDLFTGNRWGEVSGAVSTMICVNGWNMVAWLIL